MKKITIVLIVVSIVIISFTLSSFLTEKQWTFISNMSTLVTLAGTIITLIIAMILYNQLGLDQAILQKKADVMFKLLELISEKNFTIETNLGFHPLIWLRSITKYKSSYAQYGDIKLLFNQDYVDFIQPIVDLIENVFLPKEILPKIQALEPHAFLDADDKVTEKEYGKVLITGQRLSQKMTEPDSKLRKSDWGNLHIGASTSEITLSQFINYWDDLIVTSTEWVSSNSSYQDLNIPFFRNYYYQKPKKSVWQRIWNWLMADAF